MFLKVEINSCPNLYPLYLFPKPYLCAHISNLLYLRKSTDSFFLTIMVWDTMIPLIYSITVESPDQGRVLSERDSCHPMSCMMHY